VKRKILACSVVYQQPEVLRAHLASITSQETPHAAVDLLYMLDTSDPNCEANRQLVQEFGGEAIDAEPKSEASGYAVESTTHKWAVSDFYWLARTKQKLLDACRDRRYDAIWLVDSDLLCDPRTLASLDAASKDVVSAVFWTRWQIDAPPLPQVWMAHPYEFQGRGIEAHEFLASVAARGLVRVAGLGACTLIDGRVLDRVGFWPLVDGLPTHGMWQGEDRHFCVRAERNHVELWADAWPDVWHCYRPEDRAQLAQWQQRLAATVTQPVEGDLVSLTLEPCEEPALAQYRERVRGRLGILKLLPEIEAAVHEMRVDEERFVSVRFPLWHPISQYRGQRRLIRVTLLDAKPYALAPTLAEWHAPPEAIAEYFMDGATG